MKYLFLLISLFFSKVMGQDFISIESHKVISLIHFLDAANDVSHVSDEYRDWVAEKLESDPIFEQLVDRYAAIDLKYSVDRQHSYPMEGTVSGKPIIDVLVIEASNSQDIQEFNQRIIGLLSEKVHTELIETLLLVEPYYEKWIWKKKQNKLKQVQQKLSQYKTKIEEVYSKASTFYGTPQDKRIALKVVLVPIPIKKGETKTFSKGSVLVCETLLNNSEDYLLRIILREVCHKLSKEQPLEFKNKIESWVENVSSTQGKFAYLYLDEALATTIGNRYEFKELNGKMDTVAWYNNPYINGFAHAIYKQTEKYLQEEKQMDSIYIEKAIQAFEKIFPKTQNDLQLLFKEIQLHTDIDTDKVKEVKNSFRYFFQVNSFWETPLIQEENEKTDIARQSATKIFLIESNHQQNLDKITTLYPREKINIDGHFYSIYAFKNTETQGIILIINIFTFDAAMIETLIKNLSQKEYIELEKWIDF